MMSAAYPGLTSRSARDAKKELISIIFCMFCSAGSALRHILFSEDSPPQTWALWRSDCDGWVSGCDFMGSSAEGQRYSTQAFDELLQCDPLSLPLLSQTHPASLLYSLITSVSHSMMGLGKRRFSEDEQILTTLSLHVHVDWAATGDFSFFSWLEHCCCKSPDLRAWAEVKY